jgi:flagellin FlaB
MPLKKKWAKLNGDKRAEIGVGTMIIFIAMVLVSAVAASVLIDTANKVREQAQNTGNEAISSLATGVVVQDVVGQKDQSRLLIDNISLLITPQAGSPPIKLDTMVISIMFGDTVLYQTLGDLITDNSYTAQQIRASESSTWTDGMHIMGHGDLVKIKISNAIGVLGIEPDTLVTIRLMPSQGPQYMIRFTTPDVYTANYIELR